MTRPDDIPTTIWLFASLLIILTLVSYSLQYVGSIAFAVNYGISNVEYLPQSALEASSLVFLPIFFFIYQRIQNFGKIFIGIISILLTIAGSAMLLLANYPENKTLIMITYISINFCKFYLINILFFTLSNQHFSLKQARWVYPLFFAVQAIVMFFVLLLLNFFIDKTIRYVLFGIMALSSLPIIIYLWGRLDDRMLREYPITKNTTQSPEFFVRYFGYLVLFILVLSIAKTVLTIIFKQTTVETFITLESQADFATYSIHLSHIASSVTMLLGAALFLCSRWISFALVIPILLIFTGTIGKYLYHHPSLFNFWFALEIEPQYIRQAIITFFDIGTTALTPIFFILIKELAFIPLPLHIKTIGKVTIDVFVPILGSALVFSLISLYSLNESGNTTLSDFPWHVLILCGTVAIFTVIKLNQYRKTEIVAH